MKTLQTKQTLQVLRSAVGNSPVTPFETLNQASALYRAFIAKNGFGASEAGECVIRDGAKVVARISYNGKVWAGREYVAGAQPIFQP